MNDIVSFFALAGLSVLALVAVGWWACPRQERLPVAQMGRTDWTTVLRTGVHVVATWGPRFTYPDRTVQAPSSTPRTPTSDHTVG